LSNVEKAKEELGRLTKKQLIQMIIDEYDESAEGETEPCISDKSLEVIKYSVSLLLRASETEETDKPSP